MRPLIHPTIDDITVEGILHALSDPVRAAIYANLAVADCAQTCSVFLQVSDRDIPKSTLSQHFRALREAGLVRSERHGVEMHNTSRCKEIEQRFPGLIGAILSAHRVQSAGQGGVAKRKPAARKTKAG
jgi:DNA-binding transcriptional ArsR family regulator